MHIINKNLLFYVLLEIVYLYNITNILLKAHYRSLNFSTILFGVFIQFSHS